VAAVKKGETCNLRISKEFNGFLDQELEDTKNTKSEYMTAGSLIFATLNRYSNNHKNWPTSLQDAKKHKQLQKDVCMLSDFPHLLSNLERLEDAGITQNELDATLSFITKLAVYAKNEKATLEAKFAAEKKGAAPL
jgi:hypothetical protein